MDSRHFLICFSSLYAGIITDTNGWYAFSVQFFCNNPLWIWIIEESLWCWSTTGNTASCCLEYAPNSTWKRNSRKVHAKSFITVNFGGWRYKHAARIRMLERLHPVNVYFVDAITFRVDFSRGKKRPPWVRYWMGFNVGGNGTFPWAGGGTAEAPGGVLLDTYAPAYHW